jgi:hypothetical protein
VKKIIILLINVLFSSVILFAQQYRISDITYHITGVTRQYALEQNIKIDKTHIFTSEKDFMVYFNDLKQQFHNQRLFAFSDLEFAISSPDANGISNVHITVTTIDSHHMLIVPYPKYNSNSGYDMKLKMKDTNFLGSMNTMSSDMSFSLEQDSKADSASTSFDYVFGLSLDFDIPFKMGPFDTQWENTWEVSYTMGDSSPEWDSSTGFILSLPFDAEGFSLQWEVKQSAVRDYDDYSEYDDDTYFTEYAAFSVPITLQYIDNWGKVIYTPFVSATYNWDHNGIEEEDEDLSSPIYKVGQSLATSRINWIGNFRQGLSLTFTQSMGYNTQTDEIVPYASAESEIFLAFKYLGMCMDAYAFAYQHGSEKIGARLRGIRDDQKYASDTDYAGDYACKPSAAIVVNMDMPFHIWTFDFDKTKYLKALHMLNCELQIAPFFDFALAKNKVTGTNFYYKDGFYSGGLEFLVYPEKWRSLVIRASAGLDLGRTVISKYLNTDWRRNVSSYEVEIGVGLHY